MIKIFVRRTMPWRKEKGQNQLPRNMANTGHPQQENEWAIPQDHKEGQETATVANAFQVVSTHT